MKEKSKEFIKFIPAVLLGLLVIIAALCALLWFYFRGFGSRGTFPVLKSFDINGDPLKAGHGIYVRYGEGYYLPLHETAALLSTEEESHFRVSFISVRLKGREYRYNFHGRELFLDGERIEDCGTAFMLKEGTVFVSTPFLEKALSCRIFEGGEKDNRIFISDRIFPDTDFDYDWAEKSPYIAHALGGIKGRVYTNSLEAFEENYKRGFKNFEADLEYSYDGELVLIHSFERATLKELFNLNVPADNLETPLTTAEFKALKIYGKYTPLTFKELLRLMKEHPDMYLILDGKYSDGENVKREYADIVRLARETDPELLNRMVPQIYNENMYDWVMEAYGFKSLIFSWYMYGSADLEPEPLFDFCGERGIKVCAMKDPLENALLDKEAFRRGLYVFVYTINEERDRDRLFKNGVKGIYTDLLFEDGR